MISLQTVTNDITGHPQVNRISSQRNHVVFCIVVKIILQFINMSDDAIYIGSLFKLLTFENHHQITKAPHCAESVYFWSSTFYYIL